MLVALFAAAVLLQSPVSPSPAAPDLSPGTRYDSRIPTLAQVAGHAIGDELSTPEDIVFYLKALETAAPDRARLIEYGRTWEGRPLHVLIVGSPERLARLDEIRAGMGQLADPRGLAAPAAERLVATLPVVVWLMHAVHGNETTSSDAALAEAYHLLAAQGDTRVDTILREALVIIDPLQNPDGRARFLATNRQGRAAIPDPEPAAAEHDEPWPGGRPNHYLFDMNRDWLAQSQLETQGRIRVGLQWNPQVVVDLHEMGPETTYYFAPPAEPAESVHHTEAARVAHGVRPRERPSIRCPRVRLLRSRGVRRLLPGLRRLLAHVSGRHRDDLRAGVSARPGVPARRRHDPDLPRPVSRTTSPRR